MSIDPRNVMITWELGPTKKIQMVRVHEMSPMLMTRLSPGTRVTGAMHPEWLQDGRFTPKQLALEFFATGFESKQGMALALYQFSQIGGTRLWLTPVLQAAGLIEANAATPPDPEWER